MNNDIKIMIELQRCWDSIIRAKNKIEKSNEFISTSKNEISDIKNKIASLKDEIKELKNLIKQDELDLNEMESRANKLKDRKNNIHNEKELRAVEKELKKVNSVVGELEEKIILFIDELDEKEKNYSILLDEIKTKEGQFTADSSRIIEEISDLENVISENKKKFDSLIERLSVEYKPKFLKFINSKDGKAIAKVKADICGCCNFKVPPYIAIEASKDDKITVCLNCGRYIYSEA